MKAIRYSPTYTHSSKDDGEVVFVHIQNTLAVLLDETGLTTDLCGQLRDEAAIAVDGYLVVGETSSREDGNLLTAGNGVHGIDGRDTSLNHFLRVNTRVRIDGLTWWKGGSMSRAQYRCRYP